MSQQLAEKLSFLIADIDSKIGPTNYLSGEYNFSILKNISKENIKEYIKPLIESRIYEEISETLFEIFAYDFREKLLGNLYQLIETNKSINNLFSKKVKDDTEVCYNKIKSNILYEIDDEYKIINFNQNNNEIKENVNNKNSNKNNIPDNNKQILRNKKLDAKDIIFKNKKEKKNEYEENNNENDNEKISD